MSQRIAFVLAAIALAGCTRDAHLPAMLAASDAEAVFDTVEDAALTRRTFTFTNVGVVKSDPLQVELRGDRAAFAIDWDGCSGAVLEQDGHCDVVVRLDGNAPGAFDGELHVFSTAPLAASVLLHGKVAPASLTLTAIASSTVDAGQGQTAMLAFTAHNAGGSPTGVLRVTGASLPFDTVSGDCDGATLAGGASCTITLSRAVAFDAVIGTSAGTLEVAATPGGDVTASPTLTVHAAGVLSVTSVDFGQVPTLTPTTRSIVVRNPGPDPCYSVGVQLMSNDSPSPFAVGADGCSGRSLPAGASCTVIMRATLTDTTKHTAVVTASASGARSGSGMLTATGLRAHWTLMLSVAGNGGGTLTYGGSPLTVTTAGLGVPIKNGQASQPLTAAPDAASTFSGWSGSAPCTGNGTCNAFVGPDNSDVTLVATFTH